MPLPSENVQVQTIKQGFPTAATSKPFKGQNLFAKRGSHSSTEAFEIE